MRAEFEEPQPPAPSGDAETRVVEALRGAGPAPLLPVPAGIELLNRDWLTDAANLPALERFAFGSSEYPDRSTTLILQVDNLTQGPAFELKGPGIDGSAVLQAMIKPRDLLQRLAINEVLFPRGIDAVLVHDDAIVAIPRTTRLIASGV